MPARKILFYTHGLTGGGAERVWALNASRFAAAGHHVTFAVDRAADENHGFLDPRVRLVILGEGHVSQLRALARLIRTERFDVAISALGVSNLKLFLAAIAAGSLDRTILSIHGYFHSEPQRLSQIGNLSLPIMSRLTAATICVSDGLKRYVIERWHLPASKVRRIYNPVFLAMTAEFPDRQALAQRQPVIIAVGRLVPYKGYAVLIEAFTRVRTPSARLIVLGEGPERQTIEAAIAKHRLGERVSLMGYHPEPWRYYAEAKCFVLPSYSEAFGNVVVEALANGLPVIATRCHGPQEILNSPELGALVPIGDADAIATAIDAALADPGDPAPRLARAQDFDDDTAFAAYVALVEEVIAQASGAQIRARPT